MTEQEFRRLAEQGCNRIPLVVETFSDLDTPLSVYLKLANEPYTYLLESVQGGERWGRYSFIGLRADTRFEVVGRTCREYRGGTLIAETRRRRSARLRAGRPRALPLTAGRGTAALLRRPRRLLRLRHGALHRAPPCRGGQAGRARHARHPATALRSARRVRQSGGQALPHRLLRSGRAGRLHAGARRASPR